MKTIWAMMLVLAMLLSSCGDQSGQKADESGDREEAGTVGNSARADDEGEGNHGEDRKQPSEIPNVWESGESLDNFPLVDFTQVKSVNESALSDDEKKREEESNRLHQKLAEAISQNRDAVDIRDRLERDYHSTQSAIEGAFAYANYKSQRDKTEAVKAYEWILNRWPESYRRWEAIYRIHDLLDMYVYLYNYGSYHALNSADFNFNIQGRNLPQADISIYQVDLMKMVEDGVNPQAPSVPEHAQKVKTWTMTFSQKQNDWFHEQIRLPQLPPGYYILSVATRYMTMNTLFSTGHLALVTKSDGRMLLCWAKDQTEKRSVGPCKVLALKDGQVIYRGVSNKDGLFAARLKMRENDSSNFAVIMSSDKGQAVSGSYYYWYNSYSRRVCYSYTDRPVYRPGQKVHFKGIFRSVMGEDDRMVVKRENPIQVVLYDSNWKEAYKVNLELNEFGSVHGEYQVPETARLGYYYLYFSGGDGYYCNSSFEVQEYKKPEYEVSVESEKGSVLQGESCSVKVGARYYFGEIVKDADVEYQIFESMHRYYDWAWEEDWSWFGAARTDRYHYYGEENLIDQGTAKLGADGVAHISFTSRKAEGHDLKYTVRASVIDKSRRKISGFGTVLATRASFRLSLAVDRYCYRLGERIQVKLRALDYGGKGLSLPATLTVSRQGQNGYERIYSEKSTTTSDGWAVHEFVPDENGYYLFEAQAEDEAQRKITANAYCWVADSSWRSPVTYSGVNLELEKSTCLPGEKARILFTTGHADSWALFTLENQRIQSYRLIGLNGGAYNWEESVHDRLTPYVDVKVSMIESGAFVEQAKRLTVPPKEAFLDVAIARDKPEYKPGDRACYTVKVSDWQNRPVKAEFSLGLVDEAIYAIRADDTPDIRESFHLRIFDSVHTNTSFTFYAEGYGDQQQAGEKLAVVDNAKKETSAKSPVSDSRADRMSGADEKGPAGQTQLVQPVVRSEFADVGVWQPAVVTDDKGIASISFTMPDNLTTWRATVRAVTLEGKAGQVVDKVITRKNLMARLECPRTFTERDRVTVSGVVHNYLTGHKRCVCRLAVKGAKLLSPHEAEIDLAPGEDQRVDWEIEVNGIDKVELELAALTDAESDAMRMTFPVVVHGFKMLESRSGVTGDKVELALALPASAQNSRSRLLIRAKPTLAGSMLESLEYLAGYPYGCVEQTMSRFLPSVIVAQTLQALNLRHEKLEQELPKYVAQGTERLYNFQHSDGGWGWWESDQTHPFMTAYVIYGLSIARNADYAIRQDAIDRGVSALRSMIETEKSVETRSYMVFSYSQVAQPEPKWIDELYGKVDEMNDYCRAILLLTMHKQKDPRARELLTMLEKNAKVQGDLCHFEGKAWRYSWTDNPVESTAYALKAIIVSDPKHPLIPKILKWLELRKQGDHYQSTKDTAAVVFAFADYLARSGELNPSYTATLEVNGHQETFSFNGKEANTALKEFEFTPQSGDNKICLSKQGQGKLYFTACLEYYSSDENLPAQSSGIEVKREYFRLVPENQQDGTIKHRRTPLGDDIDQGEVFEVVLTLSGTRDYEYVVLEDYIPSGCEFEKETDEKQRRYYYDWSNKEERDDRLVVFFGYYANGSRQIGYKLRAETPGSYHAMPARASMMYFPEIAGNSAEKRLTILADKK